MAKPDWFILMREWVMQNHGKRGITLPFLVGARAYKENKSQTTVADARALLGEMIMNPVDGYVTETAWCSDLGAPVLRAVEAPSPFKPQIGFRRPLTDEMCFLFGTELQRRWDSSDPEELLESLVSDAEVPIMEATYSRDPHSKTYKDFEKWERTFIESAILTSD